MHDEETAGYLSLRVRALAVSHRRLAHVSMEESAERAKTLKTNFEAHVGHAKIIAAKQFFRFFDATLDQVLMRCLVESFPEKPQEVVT